MLQGDAVPERNISALSVCTSGSITWVLWPKIDKFSYFYHPSPFKHDTIFKESLFDCTY